MNAREEAAALVARMSLAEKADYCSGADFWNLAANERLGLPAIMLTDGPHGLRKFAGEGDTAGLGRSVPATCFPTAAALASTWDPDLLHQIGTALGAECRANDVAVILGPGINIKRHPLSGRNFEYFSEDPLLSGELAAAMIEGIQSQGVGACIKHFAANDQETRRMVVDAIVDERTLREIHLRSFEIAVTKAQPWMVMCAYNRLNGTYCGEHDWLVNRVLRDEWGFEGAVVTDWGAVNDRVRGIAAGLDLEMPASGGVNDRRIAAAVVAGELDETVLDRAVERVVDIVLKSRQVRTSASVDRAVHHALARRAAAEGSVLLKNDEALLPLAPATRIAVIGAFAKHPRYQGTGSSRVTPTRLDCAFDAIEAIAEGNVTFAAGYDAETSAADAGLIDDAVRIAREADVAVIFAGIPEVVESEGFDRADLRLPLQHDRLIEAVAAANPNTAVVLANGAPVEMPWLAAAKAVVEAYLGGQAGGSAVADVLFGRCNPCGKLAETFVERRADSPADPWFPGTGRQVQYREGLFVGYRYFDTFERPVRFPFGHGLSYTAFDYDDLAVTVQDDGTVDVAVTLTNLGRMDGAEITQVYIHHARAAVYRPSQELRAFRKVRLGAGERKRVTLGLDQAAFAYFSTANGNWAVEPGEYEIRIGASSRDIRLRQRIVLDGDSTGDRDTALPTLVDGRLAVDDDTFTAMLGKPIPQAEAARPFHLNSTFAEISATWLGRKVATAVKAQFARRMGGGADAATRRMIDAMANDMPLRQLVLFSGGAVGFAQIEAFVAVLNGRYLKALKLLITDGP